MPPKMTHSAFSEIVKTQSNDEIELLEEYVTTHHKIKFRHKICGYEYLMRPSRFICGDRCPKCGNAVKKTDTEYKEQLEKYFPHEYELLSPYINAMTKITTRHSCGYVWDVTPNLLLRRIKKPHNGCPSCNKKHRRTAAEFIDEVKTLTGGEYEPLEEYANVHKPIRIKHLKCGTIYSIPPKHFLRGDRCPYCALRNKTSIAVKEIEEWLRSNNIAYEREVSVEGCKLKRHLISIIGF